MKQRFFSSLVLFLLVAMLWAQPKDGYYDSAVGKSNDVLRKELQTITTKWHTHKLSYNDLWEVYKKTDINPETGKIWDMYSNCQFTYDKDRDHGFGGGSECQYYNREHTVPQSWFNEASPMKADAFHVLPTDKKVNGKRGNNPYGEVSSIEYESDNGSKLGKSKDISGTVFEPIDEYKGDFARIYFYMATRYASECNNWGNGVFSSSYSGLSDYAVKLFLKWHRQDEVSEKEIMRNNAVEKEQGNRNPFVDYPELAEYIWGNHKGEPWSLTSSLSETEVDFLLAQNPVRDFIELRTNEPQTVDYILFTVDGRMLASGSFSESASISVSDLQGGIYLLKLQSGAKKTVEKIIVE